jgi:hypothetical protein
MVSAIGKQSVQGRRVDGPRERLVISLSRLQETRHDGQGAHYQFIAWTPRRYRTWAVVVTVEAEQSILVLPEWHPGRPVRFPTRLVPADSRRAEAWVTLKANLASPSAARLNLDQLSACEDPGRSRCPRPEWRPTS